MWTSGDAVQKKGCMKHNIERIEGLVKAVIPRYLHKLIFLHRSCPFLAKNSPQAIDLGLTKNWRGWQRFVSEDAWDAANILSPNFETRS